MVVSMKVESMVLIQCLRRTRYHVLIAHVAMEMFNVRTKPAPAWTPAIALLHWRGSAAQHALTVADMPMAASGKRVHVRCADA